MTAAVTKIIDPPRFREHLDRLDQLWTNSGPVLDRLDLFWTGFGPARDQLIAGWALYRCGDA